MEKTTVVIGAGITGMSAALLAATQGERVLLVENSLSLAPLLRGFVRQGIAFDTGLHRVGGLEEGGLLRQWLTALGVTVPAFRESKEFVLVQGEQVPFAPRDAFLAWVQKQSPADYLFVKELLAEMKQSLSLSPYTCPQQRGEAKLLSLSSSSLKERLAPLRDVRIRSSLKARCLLYGVPAEDASWEEFRLVAGTYFGALSIFEHGGRGLVAAFAEALEKASVQCRFGSPVIGIEVNKGKKVQGVRLENGERILAERVVFTGSPRQLPRLLPAGCLRPAYFHHIDALQETGFPVTLYGIADASLPACHSWYTMPEEDSFVSLEEALEKGTTPTMSIMTGAASLHGETSFSLNSFSHIPLREMTEARKQSFARFLKEQATLALPALASHWRPIELSTGLAMQRWIYGSTGSVYGIAHNLNTVPLLPVTKIAGLVLAGQNILLPGLLGCIISAAVSTSFLFGKDAILTRFRRTANSLCENEG